MGFNPSRDIEGYQDILTEIRRLLQGAADEATQSKARRLFSLLTRGLTSFLHLLYGGFSCTQQEMLK